jgi:hypothetical protein
VRGKRGYDHDKYRRLVWDLGVKPVIARRGTAHGSVLGALNAGSSSVRSLTCTGFAARIRWQIRDDIHEAFLPLGCALLCWRRLTASRPQPVPPPGGP